MERITRTVLIEKCTTYEEADPKLRDILRSFNMNWQGLNVLVKPNIAVSNLRSGPDSAVVTHPLFARSIVSELISLGASVSVGDIGVGDTQYNFVGITGIEQALKGTGAKFVPFSEFEAVDIPNPLTKQVHIAKPVLNADVVVNLPKLKTHGLTILTGAVKNLYGCVEHDDRKRFHKIAKTPDEFGSILADIYSAISPKLTIMDSIVAMEGNGPIHGTPKRVGVILAGADGFSIDAVASKIIGCPPYAVPTTKAAIRNYSFSMPDMPLDPSIISKDFTLHDRHSPAFERSNTCLLLPRIDTSKCTGCGDCFRNCPNQAITMVSGRPVIDFAKCTLCYCCNELCQPGACGLEKAFPVFLNKDTPRVKVDLQKDNLKELSDSLPISPVSLDLKVSEEDLKERSGSIILNFLNALKRRGVPFVIASPLPRCLFKVGYSLVLKHSPPLSCENCPELCSSEEGSELCKHANATIVELPSGRYFIPKPNFEFSECTSCRFRKDCYGFCPLQLIKE